MQSRRSLKIQPIAVDIEELVPSDLTLNEPTQEEEPKPIDVNKIEKDVDLDPKIPHFAPILNPDLLSTNSSRIKKAQFFAPIPFRHDCRL
jgi:hypothetical protein